MRYYTFTLPFYWRENKCQWHSGSCPTCPYFDGGGGGGGLSKIRACPYFGKCRNLRMVPYYDFVRFKRNSPQPPPSHIKPITFGNELRNYDIIIIIIILYCTTLAKRRLLRRVRVKNRGGSVGVCVGVCMCVCVCVCARVRTHMSGYIYMQGRVYNCSEAIPWTRVRIQRMNMVKYWKQTKSCSWKTLSMSSNLALFVSRPAGSSTV